jgi:hypothetical protein
MRNPTYRTSEFPKNSDPTQKIDPKAQHENYTHIYENRLKYLAKCRNAFLSYLPEIEIVFGKNLRHNCLEVDHFLQNFTVDITEYLYLLVYDPKNPNLGRLRNCVIDNKRDNSCYEEFETLIKQIENRLKKEL